MKSKALFLIMGLILLLTGCDTYLMFSLNPFYSERNIILNAKVEGIWETKPVHAKSDTSSTFHWDVADTVSKWTIKRFVSRTSSKSKSGADSVVFKPENFYLARLVNNSDSNYKFKIVLFNVNGEQYADFVPFDKGSLIKSKLAANGLFEVHTLARVVITNNRLKFQWLGADCMKQMIEEKRVRIKYQWIKESGRFILTASKGDLTGMIEHYGNQTRFIDWDNQKAQLELNRLNSESNENNLQ